ncbi:MAG: 4Fe-4S dicluster domain-containing protein [Planctomycetaceae bacterium]|nr:MAG: 4Fe-4S dicluster domain-containing protein [Planctomycetaceae bacterium]
MFMKNQSMITINNRAVPINGERSLLEVARNSGIDIPTFCYHSDLSVYGACRLCLVEVEGRGIIASCSVRAEPGMVVRTHTEEIRELRKISLELLLANHPQSCTTCGKSTSCQLQSLCRRLGVNEVRFRQTDRDLPVDHSSPSLVRDPNKCVLCGDCVRACKEIQAVGAIDFVHRGAAASVAPAFGRDLAEVECVSCGLCTAVCPTGALIPKPETEPVWAALNDPQKTVVVQIAPAVRVGIGEAFGMEPGSIETGRLVASLKALGFDQVYDTGFAADLTVIEECTEFLERKASGERLPQFTSCCPAWVEYAQQFCPDMLPNLSSCRSPQQMFGSLAKQTLPEKLGIDIDDLVVVSIMPCTAKKHEAKLEKFRTEGRAHVDHVLTTQELATMIQEAGIQFRQLQPESLDMPFGFKTGAGVIFGAAGGVTEAVLRYGVEQLSGENLAHVDFEELRGQQHVREATVTADGMTLRVAIVQGLKNAADLVARVRAGEANYDLVEVMACPGGCIGGAGQPITLARDAKRQRTAALFQVDKMLQLHKPQENHLVSECYDTVLGSAGGPRAHQMLHTNYRHRRRMNGSELTILENHHEAKLEVSVCQGTSCFLRGSQPLLSALTQRINEHGLQDRVQVTATFCFEACDRGPTVRIQGNAIHHCTLHTAWAAILDECNTVPAPK